MEAYAFFEFGPELRLQPFDPGLVGDIEGLVWFGARDVPGLAQLIARKAPLEQVRETRRVMDHALRDAKATLGDDQSTATVVTNAALIVFREGLEAVLILAAITASFVGAQRRKRRPVLIGAGFGLLASALTWLLAALVLDQLSRYGEALGGVFVAAVAVLTFAMQRKLPYKRMLIVTMVLLALVLVVLVGQTARTFQGVGWLPITPVDIDISYWMGTWLGLHPTWETLGLQAVAGLSVLLSYYGAEWWRIKRPRRARQKAAAAAAAAPGAEPDAAAGPEVAGSTGAMASEGEQTTPG